MTRARTELPGAADLALLYFAEADSRVLLALEKDFWQIPIQRPQPRGRSGVIPENVTPLVLRTMSTEQEWRGHASVVTPDHMLMLERAIGNSVDESAPDPRRSAFPFPVRMDSNAVGSDRWLR